MLTKGLGNLAPIFWPSLVSTLIESPSCAICTQSTRDEIISNQDINKPTPIFLPTRQTCCPIMLESIEPFILGLGDVVSMAERLSTTPSSTSTFRPPFYLKIRTVHCACSHLKRQTCGLVRCYKDTSCSNSFQTFGICRCVISTRTTVRLSAEMNGSPRSISPLDSPLAGSPTTSDSPTFCSAENGGEEQVLFEGYLYKIPPLKKSLLMVVSFFLTYIAVFAYSNVGFKAGCF